MIMKGPKSQWFGWCRRTFQKSLTLETGDPTHLLDLLRHRLDLGVVLVHHVGGQGPRRDLGAALADRFDDFAVSLLHAGSGGCRLPRHTMAFISRNAG